MGRCSPTRYAPAARLLRTYMLLLLYHFWKPFLRFLNANGINKGACSRHHERHAEDLAHSQPPSPQVADLRIGLADELDKEAEQAVTHQEHAQKRPLNI